jgi:hypothetical protein
MQNLIIFLILIAAPVKAQNMVSGDVLYEWCNGPEGQDICSGFILGASEGFIIGSVTTDIHDNIEQEPLEQANRTRLALGICLPDTISRVEIVDTVRVFVDANPPYRKQPAAGVIHMALNDAFPCK